MDLRFSLDGLDLLLLLVNHGFHCRLLEPEKDLGKNFPGSFFPIPQDGSLIPESVLQDTENLLEDLLSPLFSRSLCHSSQKSRPHLLEAILKEYLEPLSHQTHLQEFLRLKTPSLQSFQDTEDA